MFFVFCILCCTDAGHSILCNMMSLIFDRILVLYDVCPIILLDILGFSVGILHSLHIHFNSLPLSSTPQSSLPPLSFSLDLCSSR